MSAGDALKKSPKLATVVKRRVNWKTRGLLSKSGEASARRIKTIVRGYKKSKTGRLKAIMRSKPALAKRKERPVTR